MLAFTVPPPLQGRSGHARPHRRRTPLTRVAFDGAPPPGSRPPYWWESDPPDDPDDSPNGPRSIAQLFRSVQASHPILTKGAVTGTLMATSDLVAQTIDTNGSRGLAPGGAKPHHRVSAWLRAMKWRRTAAVGAFGAFMLGPFLHAWYKALDRMFPGSPGVGVVVKKLLVDQTFAAAVVNAGFISATGLLEGKSVDQVGGSMRDHYLDAMVLNWKVWPAGQVINFALVPPAFQIMWVNMVGFVFTVGLSILAHGKPDVKH